MKYTEAIKIALKNPEFKKCYNNFRESVKRNRIAGSLQFYIGDEAFYYGGEAIWNMETEKYDIAFKGGKHNQYRAEYLIRKGQSMEIK